MNHHINTAPCHRGGILATQPSQFHCMEYRHRIALFLRADIPLIRTQTELHLMVVLCPHASMQQTMPCPHVSMQQKMPCPHASMQQTMSRPSTGTLIVTALFIQAVIRPTRAPRPGLHGVTLTLLRAKVASFQKRLRPHVETSLPPHASSFQRNQSRGQFESMSDTPPTLVEPNEILKLPVSHCRCLLMRKVASVAICCCRRC